MRKKSNVQLIKNQIYFKNLTNISINISFYLLDIINITQYIKLDLPLA